MRFSKKLKNILPPLVGVRLFFFFKKKQFWVLSTQNCREKLNNLVVRTRLALRSPMFGGKKQKKKKVVFCLKFIKSMGFLCEKWIMENREKSCLS